MSARTAIEALLDLFDEPEAGPTQDWLAARRRAKAELWEALDA